MTSLEISNEFGLNAPVNTEVIDRVATSEIISDVESTQKEMNCQTGNLRFHEMPRYMLQSLSKKKKLEYGPIILPMVQWQMLSRVWILSSALR